MTRRVSHRLLVTALLGATCLNLSACNVGRNYTPPAIPELSPSVLQEHDSDIFQAAEPVKNWWDTLQDKQLSGLVEKALLHNLDIKMAVASMEQARAISTASDLAQLPTVTAGSYGERIKQSNADVFKYPKRTYNTYQAGFDATWELDFFGHVSGQIEADNARYESSIANLQGVYVTIAAEVAKNYIELRGAQLRLALAHHNADNQQKIFSISQSLESSGRNNALDLDRAQVQLEQTLATIPPLEAQVSASINRLGVLTGQTPDALRDELREAKPLPTIPASVAVGNAGALLKRRPDVRAAERDLAASVADYNVNVADLYPQITMNGNIGFMSSAISSILTNNALTYFVQPALSWSAFDRERVEARIDASDAVTRGQLANFQQTVLGALEEVDNGMVAFSHEQQRRARLRNLAASSTRAYNISQKRYDAGLENMLDMLDDQNQMLSAQDQLAQSDTQAALDVVALYKALGGGWEEAADLNAKQSTDADKKNPDDDDNKPASNHKKSPILRQLDAIF